MKTFFKPERNTFFADRIEGLTVSRNRGFEANHKGGREKHSFIWVENGALLFRFSERAIPSIEARAGDLIFIPKKTAHTSLYTENDTRVKIVQFDLLFGSLPSSLTVPDKIEIHRAGELIDGFFTEARPHPLLCHSRLYELMYRIDRERDGMPLKFKKLQPVLDYIHANVSEECRVSHYAALCDMSEAGFRRLFREFTGQSPVDYRNGLRLERARLLLESGECNVSEAAEAMGFSNLSFFIRLYKRKYGHTPKNG